MNKTIPLPEDPLIKKHNISQRDLDLSRRETDLLNIIGIHVDYLDDLAAGRPFGADIIDIKNGKRKS